MRGARSDGPARRAPHPPLVSAVFTALADGRFHSGEALALRLQVSRSAIWKAARALRALGAPLQAVRNRGYRLARSGEPLEAGAITRQLPRAVRPSIGRIDVAWSVASTNTVLLSRPNPPPGTSEVALAEVQTAGRGRRGRAWLAPPGGSLCLSLSWTFGETPADLSALGLVIGVCTLRALQDLGVAEAALKWPNDLLVGGRKAGGILIELRAEGGGPACVVIGIGLNVVLGRELLEAIRATGTAATDLASAAAVPLSRNAVAAAVLGRCVAGLQAFARSGFLPFAAAWQEADALAGRAVSVTAAESVVKGLARGIDAYGALLVETPQGLQRFVSGDVTVRAA
jgi:BirA family transcriptional regulator, biotin operon repressor / biotin---[acetyl-CoA-carboxylase] ligase